MRNLLFVASLSLAAMAFGERQPYERYQLIVDRQMFGPLPPGFDPAKSPAEVARTSAKNAKELTKEQEQIKKAIRFSVMNVNPAGEAYVGFTDSGDPQHPAHYYLKVGETQNGWTVKEADAATSTMTIENAEGIEVTLQLGGDSATNASAVSRPDAAAPASDARLQSGQGAGALFGGLRSRRELRRRQEEQQQQQAAARRAEEDLARAQREAEEKRQREADRAAQAELREQLMSLKEEQRKEREAREAAEKKANSDKPESGASEEIQTYSGF